MITVEVKCYYCTAHRVTALNLGLTMENLLNKISDRTLTPHMALTHLRIVERFTSRKERVEHHNRTSPDVKLHKKVAPNLQEGP